MNRIVVRRESPLAAHQDDGFPIGTQERDGIRFQRITPMGFFQRNLEAPRIVASRSASCSGRSDAVKSRPSCRTSSSWKPSPTTGAGSRKK